MRVTGKLNVTTAGTYSFGIGSDDGGRLEIDIDKNGFGANDKIIESLGPQGHTLAYGNATFATAGVYDFQVISYNSGGGGDVEVSVAKAAGAGKTNLVEAPDEWELLGSSGATRRQSPRSSRQQLPTWRQVRLRKRKSIHRLAQRT